MNPNLKIILSDIDNSTNSFETFANTFTEEEFNHKLNKDVWCAGEVVEHVTLLESLILKVLKGDVEPTHRAIDEKTALVKSVFGNFERKLFAPDPIQPLSEKKEREELVQTFREQRDLLKEIAITDDLSKTCLSFVHRAFGEFTRLEWIYFNIYHSERHLQQLRNIKALLNFN